MKLRFQGRKIRCTRCKEWTKLFAEIQIRGQTEYICPNCINK